MSSAVVFGVRYYYQYFPWCVNNSSCDEGLSSRRRYTHTSCDKDRSSRRRRAFPLATLIQITIGGPGWQSGLGLIVGAGSRTLTLTGQVRGPRSGCRRPRVTTNVQPRHPMKNPTLTLEISVSSSVVVVRPQLRSQKRNCGRYELIGMLPDVSYRTMGHVCARTCGR